MGALTPDQQRFAATLAKLTGLSPQTVGAWELGEESGQAAQSRQQANNQNWLNIGYFDSGPGAITQDKAFHSTPEAAAQQTANFLKGSWGGASSGIKGILGTAGQSPSAQLAAIARSGWASSGYGGAKALQSLLGSTNVPAAAGASIPNVTPVGDVSPQLAQTTAPNIFQTLSGLEAGRQALSGTSTPDALQQGWDLLGQLLTTRQQPTSTPTPTDSPVASSGYVNPFHGAQVSPSRIDQGVDYTVKGPIRAIGNSHVVYSGNYSGFGPYVALQFDDGPRKGQVYYFSEGIRHNLKNGQRVTAGQQIATGVGGIETGFAQNSGGYLPLAKATGGYTEGQRTAAGDAYDKLMRSLGVVGGTAGGRSSIGQVPSSY